MSRKWVLFLCAVIMLALALVVARVFREPLPPLSGEDAAQVGDSVSGPLQAAPQTPLPSPLPSPEAMIMSSGDSGDLPVTHVEPQAEGPTGVAPVVKDSTFGSVQVTEPPASSAVPAAVKPEDGDKAPSSSSASGPDRARAGKDRTRRAKRAVFDFRQAGGHAAFGVRRTGSRRQARVFSRFRSDPRRSGCLGQGRQGGQTPQAGDAGHQKFSARQGGRTGRHVGRSDYGRRCGNPEP